MSSHRTAPSGAGTVVLDLGAGTGVLILYVPASWDGAEIPVSGPVDTHSMVRRRDVGDPPVYAAVYPSLPSGSYVVGPGPMEPGGTAVNIRDGAITSVHIVA